MWVIKHGRKHITHVKQKLNTILRRRLQVDRIQFW